MKYVLISTGVFIKFCIRSKLISDFHKLEISDSWSLLLFIRNFTVGVVSWRVVYK